MIIYLDHPARPRSSASFPLRPSLTLLVEQKPPTMDISLYQNPHQIMIMWWAPHGRLYVLFILVKLLAGDPEHAKNSVYVLHHHLSLPPLWYYYSQGTWYKRFHQGQDRAAPGLGLMPKPHTQMRIVSWACGRLSTQNQYPGEAVKIIQKRKVLYFRWIFRSERACVCSWEWYHKLWFCSGSSQLIEDFGTKKSFETSPDK